MKLLLCLLLISRVAFGQTSTTKDKLNNLTTLQSSATVFRVVVGADTSFYKAYVVSAVEDGDKVIISRAGQVFLKLMPVAFASPPTTPSSGTADAKALVDSLEKRLMDSIYTLQYATQISLLNSLDAVEKFVKLAIADSLKAYKLIIRDQVNKQISDSLDATIFYFDDNDFEGNGTAPTPLKLKRNTDANIQQRKKN